MNSYSKPCKSALKRYNLGLDKKLNLFTESKNCLGLFSHIFHTLWHEDGCFLLEALGLLKHLIHKMARDNQIVSNKRLIIGSAANMCHYRCPFRLCSSPPTPILPTLATLLLLSFFHFLHVKKIVLLQLYFTHYIYITFIHLTDAFIQSDLQLRNTISAVLGRLLWKCNRLQITSYPT